MFRDFLWFLHAKQSHDMQKSNGFPGFLALVVVFVIMFKWDDWFAPIFFGLELDKIPAMLNADHGDFYAMTFIHMLAWIFLICIAIGILMIVGYLLFMTPLAFILVAPLLLIALIGMVVIDLIKSPFKKKTILPPLDPLRSRVARKNSIRNR